MGNTCCKPKTRVSPDDQPHTRSRRWRLKQALGLGKFCATVDVQRDTTVSPSLSTVVNAASERAILDGSRCYRHFLLPNSSEARIQDKEASGSDCFSKTAGNGNHGQAIDTQSEEIDSGETVPTVSMTVGNTPHTADTDDDEREGSPDTGQSTQRTTTYLDYNGNIVVHDNIADDDDLTAYNSCTSQVHHTTSSKSDSSTVSNDEILPNRELCPVFFSASSCRSYDEFPGELDIEIEEDIQADLDDTKLIDDAISDGALYSANGDSSNTIGQGVVVLDDADIKAAISRLAILREGIDPEMDKTQIFKCSTTDNDNRSRENTGQNGHATEAEGQNNKKETDKTKVGDKDRLDAAMVDDHNLEDKRAVTDGDLDINYDCGKENTVNVTAATDSIVYTGRDSSLPKPDKLKVSRNDKKEFERNVGNVDVGNSGTCHTKHTVGLGEKNTSEESIKSWISFAAALSLEVIKSHNTRSDCLLSLCVRPPHRGLQPRKTVVRASAKQIKDGTAEKHLKLLKNIHNLPKVVDPTMLTPKRTKKHLYTSPALAKRDDATVANCVQKQGNPGLPRLHSVPSFYEPTTKGPNAREKLGLEQLKKFNIGIQCKSIERIKIDADEFPGILPPRIRTKWKQKVDEKKHIN